MSSAETLPPSSVAANDAEQWVLDNVERYLSDGLLLKAWYDKAHAGGKFREQFDLTRTANKPDRSYGFFHTVELSSGATPVMGNYQEMFYDQPGAMAKFDPKRKREWLDQVREFVLHYFLRISSFSHPEAHISSGYPSPSSYRGGLSWSLPEGPRPGGMGFTQIFAKIRGSGKIVRFSEHEKYAITDLRQVAKKYQWIVLKVRIFDFNVKVRPLGPSTPQVVAGLNESSYLVLSPEFIIDEENVRSPGGEPVSRYGLGYAFIRDPERALTRYGPGEFDAAFESIHFVVDLHGKITVQMAFCANRPEQVTAVNVNPIKWGFQIADAVSGGWASRLLPSVKKTLPGFGLGTFDPVYAYISAANAVTAGQAAQALAISREQLDKRFLLLHFNVHYATVLGSLVTWRQIPDWRDGEAIPDWVATGGLIHD
jgi:hypothetical protein